MGLIRLAYASEANFQEQVGHGGIEPDITQILMASRRSNPKLGLVGGLYYGDGHFFQCLEGESDKVHALFNRICGDHRHRKVTLLFEEPIKAYAFDAWSMKYIAVETAIVDFLKSAGQARFDPFAFDADMLRGMIDLLSEEPDSAPSIATVGESTEGTVTLGRERAGLFAAAIVTVVAAVVVSGFLA
ncbi:BLUF domain-containing protein [Marinobacter fonticola]|uniref:BLUF domain-containing protein n=1 Tax=Marinobacter fonticola TaxID=2603215 RepID=UPI0011E7E352|nr:BLUF domain-containing protein [Marinobacter fonticola]